MRKRSSIKNRNLFAFSHSTVPGQTLHVALHVLMQSEAKYSSYLFGIWCIVCNWQDFVLKAMNYPKQKKWIGSINPILRYHCRPVEFSAYFEFMYESNFDAFLVLLYKQKKLHSHIISIFTDCLVYRRLLKGLCTGYVVFCYVYGNCSRKKYGIEAKNDQSIFVAYVHCT